MQHAPVSATAGEAVKHAAIVLSGLLLFWSFFTPRTAVEAGPVKKALASASSSDRAKVAAIYRALGAVTARDKGSQIVTTAIWRSVHSAALRLSVGSTDLVGKYPGLDKAVDDVLASRISLDNLSLTAEVDDPSTEAVDKKPLWQLIVAACEEVEKQSGG